MRLDAVRRSLADPYTATCSALVLVMVAVTVQGQWVSDFWTHSATLAEPRARPYLRRLETRGHGSGRLAPAHARE